MTITTKVSGPLASLVFGSLLTACGVGFDDPPLRQAWCADCAGAVSPGVEVEVSAAWHDGCRGTIYNLGPLGSRQGGCIEVPYAMEVRCVGDASCSIQPLEGSSAFDRRAAVTFDGAGEVTVEVTLQDRDSGEEASYAFGPVRVVSDVELSVTCETSFGAACPDPFTPAWIEPASCWSGERPCPYLSPLVFRGMATADGEPVVTPMTAQCDGAGFSSDCELAATGAEHGWIYQPTGEAERACLTATARQSEVTRCIDVLAAP